MRMTEENELNESALELSEGQEQRLCIARAVASWLTDAEFTQETLTERGTPTFLQATDVESVEPLRPSLVTTEDGPGYFGPCG